MALNHRRRQDEGNLMNRRRSVPLILLRVKLAIAA
jgi:hypothetical protein